METPRFSKILIFLVVISTTVAIFGVALGSFNSSYGDYVNETQLEAYNQLNNISQDAREVKDSVEDIDEDSSAFDVIGAYFASGYKAFRVALQGFNVVDSVSNQALEDSPIGNSEAIQIFRVGVGTILVIVIFISILLSLIFKWWV